MKIIALAASGMAVWMGLSIIAAVVFSVVMRCNSLCAFCGRRLDAYHGDEGDCPAEVVE